MPMTTKSGMMLSLEAISAAMAAAVESLAASEDGVVVVAVETTQQRQMPPRAAAEAALLLLLRGRCLRDRQKLSPQFGGGEEERTQPPL